MIRRGFYDWFWLLIDAMAPVLLASAAILVLVISYEVDRAARRQETDDDEG